MKEIAKTHKEQLERVLTNIKNSWNNFEKNYKRYNDFRRYVFVSSISETQKAALHTLKRPIVEFNILEAFISRLIGEFSKNEPSIRVTPKDGKKIDPQTLEVVAGYIRACLQESANNGMQYNVYRDTLSGGFSAIKIYTEYSGEMSFHQDICMKRVFDPTLIGFDPLAAQPDKGDGDYCFELVPKRLEDFKMEYPGVEPYPISGSSGTGDSVGPFVMNIKTGKDAMVLVADYYEKKKVNTEIVMLVDDRIMTMKDYKKFLAEWEETGQIAQPPAIVGKPRKTEITKIVRYKLVETEVIDYEETDFKQLPIVFVDGNSIIGKESEGGPMTQITRPYVYQAKGAQELKNLSGQMLCNEIENLGPAKAVVSIQSLPDKKYMEAYTQPQDSVVKIYSAFYDNNPAYPLAPPTMEPRQAIPPEVPNAFASSDQLMQNILGSFDASLARMSKDEISGVAIQEQAVLSNAAALPYFVNYLAGLKSVARGFVNLLPLYMRTPRTIPVISKEGKRSYIEVNKEGGVSFDYDHDALDVQIDPGPSFTVQKARALSQIVALMNASPRLAELINKTSPGILLDNIDIINGESLKETIEKAIEEEKQQPAQPTPEQQAIQVAQQQVQAEHEAAMAKVQQSAAAEQLKAEMRMQELEIDRQQMMMDMAKIKADYELGLAKLGIAQQDTDVKSMSAMVDASIRAAEHHHDVNEKKFDKAMRIVEHVASQSEPEERQEENEDNEHGT